MTKAGICGAFGACLLAMVSTATPARAESECLPSIVLRGDDGEVAAELARRGLLVPPNGACGQLSVVIEVTPAGERRVIREDGVVREERAATDAQAAATVIEAWMRSDLAAPLLAVREVRATRASGAEPLPRVRIITLTGPDVSVRHIEVEAGSDFGVALDGSTWTGVSAAVCLNIHVLCIGAQLRGAFDNQTSGDTKQMDASRYGVDTLFTVDLPIRRARWALYPGLGVGQGFQQVILHSNGDGDELAGLRVRARTALAVRIDEKISIVINPEIVWSPGNPRIVVDADEGPVVFRYPGDPGLHFRVGLGLRMEAL